MGTHVVKTSVLLQTWFVDYFYLIAGILFFLAGAVCSSRHNVCHSARKLAESPGDVKQDIF